jgi:hypothetical protein
MRKFLVVVLMLLASPAFAQNWQTSVLQTRLVSTIGQQLIHDRPGPVVRNNGGASANPKPRRPVYAGQPLALRACSDGSHRRRTLHRDNVPCRRCVDSQRDAQHARYFCLAGRTTVRSS